MTLLALLRHAETAWSAEGRVQGRTDIPLGPAGHAALSGKQLPAEAAGFQVVSSPLVRCTETARALGLRGVRLEPRIAEMSWGLWEGRRLSELRRELGGTMQANEARGLDFTPPQGESPRQVLLRIQPWLAEVAAQGAPTLAVSHRGVIRVVLASACAWDMLGKPPARLDWNALHLFELTAAGQARVVRLNVPLVAAPVVVSAAHGSIQPV